MFMDFDSDDEILAQVANQVERDLEATKPSKKHIQCLQRNFGHDHFLPKQWDIIRSIIEDKRDNFVIMPTGYGKSLCFQFPAVYKNGITLVVSPLISLMQDQVSALTSKNIPACFLGSAQTDQHIESHVIDGNFCIVYASPEYIVAGKGQQLLRDLESKLTLVAIDESHCISAFGHEFRSSYRMLGCIRKEIPSVPIIAVTATATQRVRKDIMASLGLKHAQVISMGFDRPNIHFSFRKKSDIWNDLKPFVKQLQGSTIIYVLTKKDCEKVAQILTENGVNCEFYHAGLSLKKRENILDHFIRDRLRIIVATVAFGMGIDKTDVRFIVHYGASKNIESFYQEVGRAGRDGQPSRAITFYNFADFAIHKQFLKKRKSEPVIAQLQINGQKMRNLCHTTMCRRQNLLRYFDSEAELLKSRENCCDNCDSGSSFLKLSDRYEDIDDQGNHDFTEHASLLLRAMQVTKTSMIAISVLIGSNVQKALRFVNNKEFYGAGNMCPKKYWMELVALLKYHNYIEIRKLSRPYRPIQVISPKGIDWLHKSTTQPLKLKVNPQMMHFFKRKNEAIRKKPTEKMSDRSRSKLIRRSVSPRRNECKNKTASIKPLQSSQKPNQMEVNTEAKMSTKLPSVALNNKCLAPKKQSSFQSADIIIISSDDEVSMAQDENHPQRIPKRKTAMTTNESRKIQNIQKPNQFLGIETSATNQPAVTVVKERTPPRPKSKYEIIRHIQYNSDTDDSDAELPIEGQCWLKETTSNANSNRFGIIRKKPFPL